MSGSQGSSRNALFPSVRSQSLPSMPYIPSPSSRYNYFTNNYAVPGAFPSDARDSAVPIQTIGRAVRFADQPMQAFPTNASVLTSDIVEMQNAADKPILIAVFGKTGTGKTSFIQSVTGKEMKVGHGLESSTKEVVAVSFDLDGKEVKLVDTPGFDDTELSDIDILSSIANWLKDSFDENCLLSGIIYLHRITDVRMDKASKKSLRMFRSMCGAKNLRNMILATTMWENTNEEGGSRREKDLKENYWKDMLAQGSEVMRISNDARDARRFIRKLVKNNPIILKLQDELSVQNKSLGQTDAGAEIKEEMEKLRQKYQKEVENTKREIKEANARRNKELQDELKEEMAEVYKKLELLEKDNAKLAAKPSILPKNRRKGWFQTRWTCLGCDHKTAKSGKYTCRGCSMEQRNISY